jgi:hypothetical protein
MTYSVYHVGLDLVLNLSEPDLGHPSMPGLWSVLRADKRPAPERGLQCMECMASRPNCPEWMVLVERGGLRYARHHNTSIPDHPLVNESDQHKAFKERIANAAISAGHEAVMEDRAADGKRRTDVLIRGAGDLRIGHEVQLSYITASSVRRRSMRAWTDGITPLWTTVDRTSPLIDQAPWTRTDDMDWQYVSSGRELQVRGGVRELALKRCDLTNPLPCPVRGYGRCGQLHGSWDLALNVQLDDLVRDSASGLYVPIAVQNGRLASRMWVRSADRDRFLDSGGVLLGEDELARRRAPRQRELTAPQPIDPECRYGVDTGYRSPPAVVRDVEDAIAAPAVTVPAVRVQPAPVRRLSAPGRCGAGAGPCGAAPARFYACGWRCEEHKP